MFVVIKYFIFSNNFHVVTHLDCTGSGCEMNFLLWALVKDSFKNTALKRPDKKKRMHKIYTFKT